MKFYTAHPLLQEFINCIMVLHAEWIAGAGAIYDAAGKQICRKLWNAFNEKKERLTDEQLVIFLEKATDKSIAGLVKNWDRDTKY